MATKVPSKQKFKWIERDVIHSEYDYVFKDEPLIHEGDTLYRPTGAIERVLSVSPQIKGKQIIRVMVIGRDKKLCKKMGVKVK